MYSFARLSEENLAVYYRLRETDDSSEKIEKGRAKLAKSSLDARLMFAGDVHLANLTRLPVPRPIYSLKTREQLSRTEASALLEFAQTLSREAKVTLNYTLDRAFDLSSLALAKGWQKEFHGYGYRVDLQARADLKPDDCAEVFALKHLLSPAFADFYRPIWQTDHRVQSLQPFEEEIHSLHENCGEHGEGVYLLEGGKRIAAGIAGYHGRRATMTVIGVIPEKRRQGWGTRLHRQLMWLAAQHCEVYNGSTSTDNVGMCRVFESNSCELVAEVWQLKAP